MNANRRQLVEEIYDWLAAQHQNLSPEVLRKAFDPKDVEGVSTGRVSR